MATGRLDRQVRFFGFFLASRSGRPQFFRFYDVMLFVRDGGQLPENGDRASMLVSIGATLDTATEL